MTAVAVTPTITDGRVIDCCVHHGWASSSELAAYLSPGWREYIGRPDLSPGGRGMAPLVPAPGWTHPDSDWLPGAGPAGGAAPAVDPGRLEAQLAARGVERAVLFPTQGLVAGALPHTGYSLDLVRAINDWTVERWLGDGGRLHGLVLVSTQLAAAAVEEIRRVGRNPWMVGVLLAGNGLGRPFGHPGYHPIYAAAAELGLPVVMHVGGEEPPNAAAHPVAGGLPSTFGEYHVLRAQPVMTHLMSVIAQGVLERHRDLRVVAVGAGMAWLPGWLWRFDSDFRAYGSDETPWLKRSPSEQLVEQVRVATYSFGAIQDVSGFQRLLGSAPWLSATLCYGGGFPRWDADSPETVAAAFPPGWRDAVLRDNALAAFRWPDR